MSRTESAPCPRCGGAGRMERISPAWLRQRRVDAGVTLTAMAERIGVSLAQLSRVERGERTCTKLVAAEYDRLAPMLGQNPGNPALDRLPGRAQDTSSGE